MRSICFPVLSFALLLSACNGVVEDGGTSGAAAGNTGGAAASGTQQASCNGTSVTHWTSPDATRAVVADADAVYFTTWGTPWPGGVGAIVRAPLSGGVSQVLSDQETVPYAIAQDKSRLYWTDYDAGAVRSISKQGGAPLTLASGLDGPTALAVRDGTVFFTDNGAVDRVSTQGGEVAELLHTGGDVTAVVDDGAHLFVHVGVAAGQDPAAAALWRVSPDGADPVELARGAVFDTTEGTWSLAEQGQWLYWASTGDDAVYRIDKQTGDRSVVAHAPSPFGVAVSGGYLYWSTGRSSASDSDRGISRTPLSGGTPEPVLAFPQALPYVLAVTPGVIAATTGAGNGDSGGEVLRIRYCP